MSNLDGDVNSGGEVQLFELIHSLGGRIDNIQQAFMGALFERFMGFLIRMWRSLDSEPFNPGRQWDWSGDPSSSSFDGLDDIVSRLIDHPVIVGLESNSYALSCHIKEQLD
jgi:hypothetical protein